MKKLILIRHAKSSWEDPLLDDHERPLNDRGHRDAPQMAQRLKEKEVIADLIISSTAVRAKATAYITAERLDFPKEEILIRKDLYHTSENEMLKVLTRLPDTLNTVLLIGHNPGLNDLIIRLGGKIKDLPTAGQFAFSFDTSKWSEIDAENSKVWFVDHPKKVNH